MNDSEIEQNDQEKNQYHHGNLQQALVEAGLTMLEASESSKISLRGLARQVGVSANAVYRHFANKEMFLLTLANEGFSRLKRELDQARANSSEPRYMILNAGHAYIQFAQSNPALFRLMFGRLAKEHCKAELSNAAKETMEDLYGAVALHQGLDRDDPRLVHAVLHVWGLVHGLSHLLLDGQIQGMAGDTLDELINGTLTEVHYKDDCNRVP